MMLALRSALVYWEDLKGLVATEDAPTWRLGGRLKRGGTNFWGKRGEKDYKSNRALV